MSILITATTDKTISYIENFKTTELEISYEEFSSFLIPENFYINKAFLNYTKLHRRSIALATPVFKAYIYPQNSSVSHLLRNDFAEYTWGSDNYVNCSDDIMPYLNNTGKFTKFYFNFSSQSLGTSKKELKNISIEYICLPYKLNIETNQEGSCSISHYEENETGIYLTANAAPGYKLKEWSNGATEETILFDPGAIQDEIVSIYPIFEPISYTIEYYSYNSLTKKQELIYTQDCLYDEEYLYLEKPNIFTEFIEGYSSSETGWNDEYNFYFSIQENIVYNSSNKGLETYQFNSTFKNLSYDDGTVIKRYYGLYPIKYKIIYKAFRKNTTNSYSTVTGSRVYGRGDTILDNFNIFSLSDGYKLTNQMSVINGPVDNNIVNEWFVSVDYMNPGDKKISGIDQYCTEDITVYSYETPINFTIYFQFLDTYNNIISSKEIKTYYGEENIKRIELPNILGYYISGWYSQEQTISNNSYYDVESQKLINFLDNPDYSSNSLISKNYCNIDQEIKYEYAYYIPYRYYIDFKWLDNWGIKNETLITFPSKIYRKYGEEDIQIPLIPSYPELYTIKNENTIKWYYYDENKQLQENNQSIILSTDNNNYVFYAEKEPLARVIKISSNNPLFGTVKPVLPSIEDWFIDGDFYYNYFNENDQVIIKADTSPTQTSYFSNWSDGFTNSEYEFQVGSFNQDLIAEFRSNQIFRDLIGAKAIYKNTQLVNPTLFLGNNVE